MIAFISSLPDSGVMLAMGAVIGGFWITVRGKRRLDRRRRILQGGPCRRCGARN